MKIWEKPKLVILTRNNPQEAVLTFCKTGQPPDGVGAAGFNGSPQAGHSGCMWYLAATEINPACGVCQQVDVS